MTEQAAIKSFQRFMFSCRQHWATSYLSDTVMVPGTELHLLLWLNWLGHITPRHNHVGQQWQKVGQGGNHLSKATPECFVLLVEIEYHRNGYDECSYVICSNYLHNLSFSLVVKQLLENNNLKLQRVILILQSNSCYTPFT